MPASTGPLRTAMHVALERTPSKLLHPLLRGDPFGKPFDEYDGHTLLGGYRDAVKARWRGYWWSTRILSSPAVRDRLDSDAASLVSGLFAARTLPAPLTEYAAAAHRLAERMPGRLLPTDLVDARTGATVLELLPSAGELDALAGSYRSFAANVANSVSRAGGRLEGARVLDVGTGSGYLAFALAGVGATAAIGMDLTTETRTPRERDELRARLAGERTDAARLVEGDVHRLPFEDESFDVVCSGSAVEHFQDARLAMREIARVLRPRGVTFHGVDPWFGVHGGHALCTLDFPWGHLRLDEHSLADYARRLRPHEADDAIEAYGRYFQRPPLSLAESRDAWIDAGLDLIEWRPLPIRARDPHRALLDGAALRDIRRRYSSATRRDLLALGYTVVARKP